MKGEMSSNSAFSEHVLAEKLSKLNNSQQSIETLSHWCIFHRKKARNVVEIWEKQFNSSNKDHKVSLLYLSNDILQNSKRKGGEFVNEFWKVLPACLRHVFEHGEESGKKVVTRLVDIWDERKVFGSRSRTLKDDIFGETALAATAPTSAPVPAPASALDISGKSSNSNLNSHSNPVKIARKDATTLRVKLAVGAMPEKIVTSYQSLFDENLNETAAVSNCCTSVGLLEKIEKDLNEASSSGNQQQVSSLMSDIQENEASLKKSIEQLEGIEALRTSLINQLKEAIKEQETKSELARAQIEVARSKVYHTSQASQLKRKLSSPLSNGSDPTLTATPPPPGNADEEYKKTAAAVAAKLAASSSSAQLFTSVLSSFAAEHGHNGTSNGPPGFSPDKRQRFEPPFSQGPVMPFQPPLPPVPPPVGPGQMQQFGPPFAFPGGQIPPPPPFQQMHGPPSTLPLPPPGQQQQGTPTGFFSPPGVGFFNQLQPAPSAQRQQ